MKQKEEEFGKLPDSHRNGRKLLILGSLTLNETKVWISNGQDFPPRMGVNQQVIPEMGRLLVEGLATKE